MSFISKIFKILILILITSGIVGFGLPTKISEGMEQVKPPLLVKDEKPAKTRPLYVPDEVIIKFKRGAAKASIEKLFREQGVAEKYESKFAQFKVLKTPKGKQIPELVEIFKKSPLVEYAEPNYYRYALWYPNDPYYQYQWHFDDDHTKNPGGATSNPYGGTNGGGIRMEQAWSITSGSSTIKVAIVDTGIAYENYGATYKKAPDLASTTFVAGYDFANGDSHPNDDNGHGTHVAGTVAQSTDNNTGVAGIAFNTAIMPVKVLNKWGEGTDVWVSDGIHFAVDNGAKVINLSLGGAAASTVLENAVKYAYDNGVTVIAAAGNDGTDSIDYPAAYDSYVIAVGATRYDETRSSYSDYGSSLDLAAPGGDVSVDQNKDTYGDGVLQQTLGKACGSPQYDFVYCFMSGTSMATPHVSGVAALLLSQDPARTPAQIRNILQSTAEDKGTAGWDQYYGYGLVDAYAALTYVLTLSRPTAFPINSWYMISVPLIPQDSTPEAVFGDDLGNVFYDWILAQWQPQGQAYKYHKATCCPWLQSETSTLTVSPGSAYWLTARLGPTNIDATGTLVPDQDYYIHLLPGPTPEGGGWNQIGDPFNYTVAWSASTIKVKNTATGEIVSLDTAQGNGWLENKIWWWDGSEYQFAIAPAGQLDPWAGYWVHNFIECDLIVTPTPLGGSSQATESLLENSSLPLEELKQKGGKDWLTGQKGKSSPEWQIQLSVSANSQKDTYNFVGLKHKAKEDYDSWDVLEPPAISSGINLYFPHQDWSFNPGNFAQDIRRSDPSNREIVWDFEIKNDLKNTPITLKWLGLDQVGFYELALIDLEANQTIDIYNTPAYTYNSGEGGVRHFKLTAKMGFKNRR